MFSDLLRKCCRNGWWRAAPLSALIVAAEVIARRNAFCPMEKANVATTAWNLPPIRPKIVEHHKQTCQMRSVRVEESHEEGDLAHPECLRGQCGLEVLRLRLRLLLVEVSHPCEVARPFEVARTFEEVHLAPEVAQKDFYLGELEKLWNEFISSIFVRCTMRILICNRVSNRPVLLGKDKESIRCYKRVPGIAYCICVSVGDKIWKFCCRWECALKE